MFHQRPDHVQVRAVADHHGRFGVGKKVFEFAGPVTRIQGMEHEAAPQAGEVQAERLRRLGHLHGDTVAGHNSGRRQEPGQPRGFALHIGVAVFVTGVRYQQCLV